MTIEKGVDVQCYANSKIDKLVELAKSDRVRFRESIISLLMLQEYVTEMEVTNDDVYESSILSAKGFASYAKYMFDFRKQSAETELSRLTEYFEDDKEPD
jgi:hypothetical protein